MKSLIKIIQIFVGLNIILLVWYIASLFEYDYISINGTFSLENTAHISPFLGVLLSSLFSVISAYLLCINFIEFRKINTHYVEKDKLEIAKKIQEIISNLGEKYFEEIQTSYIELIEKGIFKGTENCHHYLKKPYRIPIDKFNLDHNRALENFKSNQTLIALHLSSLEVFSETILKSGIELSEFRSTLKNKFIGQTEKVLIFLTICRNTDDNFGDSIIELFEKWGGQTGDFMDRLSIE